MSVMPKRLSKAGKVGRMQVPEIGHTFEMKMPSLSGINAHLLLKICSDVPSEMNTPPHELA